MHTQQMSIANPSTGDTSQADPSSIQLAGYELKSLLGSGGYGEVWKAIGPGGFPKAVKVLYGRRDSKQAATELTALHRMRELRHPFLLNIERVEVCNDRLIVVTELADGNLNEHFEACKAKGLAGIPRPELLGYLRDAADALDFMSQEHGLQHLDVKPDNLLLQGKHIQIGDFGLAKDISVTNMSMINGFTPLYASPELFEGRPGRSSDQYSLAIVYQTMLTGKPPFNGRNAAQLTSQHLRSQPDLTHLPPSDRPVIARALSKTPTSRYASCRELVDELFQRNRASRHGGSNGSQPQPDTHSSKPHDHSPDSGLQRPAEAEASRPMAIASDAGTTHRLRPTLFIGVGGMGGTILRQLKRTCAQSIEGDVPAWQVLAIDTDSGSLRSVPGMPSTGQLNDIEALPIALRTSQDYRKTQSLDLSWLSRRWLFNIPRSGQVEGMRPLGRLAVHDHLNSLKIRIRDRLSQTVDPDSIAQSATATSTPFSENAIDVYIVASISGGTGSGAVGDVALIVKELLAEIPGLESNVCGLLLHASSHTQRVAGIQTANTIACLKELRLLGTEGMGVPKGFSRDAAELTPFDHTWLLHCGDEQTAAEFGQATESTAEFLFNATTSPAATQWRGGLNSGAVDSDGEPAVHLLGMSAVDSDVYSMAESEAASLAASLTTQWSSSPKADGDQIAAAVTRAEELLTALKLTAKRLPERVLHELRSNAGRQIEQLSETVFGHLSKSTDADSLQERLAREFSNTQSGSGGDLLNGIQECVRQSLNHDQQTAETQIQQLLLELTTSATPGEYEAAVATSQDILHAAMDCCEQLHREVDTAFQELEFHGTGQEQFQESCRHYCVLKGSLTIYNTFQRYIRNMQESVVQAVNELEAVPGRISNISQHLADTYSVHSGIPQPVVNGFRDRIANDEVLQIKALRSPDFNQSEFIDRLIDQATGFLLTAGAVAPASHETFPATTWPCLQGLGGRHRVLAWIPDDGNDERWKTRLTHEFGDCVAVYPATTHRISAICEVQGISSLRLLKHFQMSDGATWELAERIHTRTDVQW